MANPTQPRPDPLFRAELDNGQIVEADGSTVADPATDSQVPAVLLRMTPARAHTLAHVVDDWCRIALVFATLRSAEVTERALAWTLENGAAALGDADARALPAQSPRCAVGRATARSLERAARTRARYHARPGDRSHRRRGPVAGRKRGRGSGPGAAPGCVPGRDHGELRLPRADRTGW